MISPASWGNIKGDAMFSIKNRDNIPHDLMITGPQGSTLQMHLEPGQTSGPYPDAWREYFLKTEVPWAVIYPQPEDFPAKPVVIQSIGAIETEPPAVKAKPKQRKKRSK